MILSLPPAKVRRVKLLIYAAIAAWLCISFLFTPSLCGGEVQKVDSDKIGRAEDPCQNKSPLFKFANNDYKTSGELVGQFVKGILFVALLATGVFFMSKKVLPKFAVKTGKNISITETVQLGRNKTLHLVKINDNQTMLIGSTNENINLIADVTVSILNDDYDQLTE